MGSFQTRACVCEDYPCCGCATETVLTGAEAVEEYERELAARYKGDCDGGCDRCNVINCCDREEAYVEPADALRPNPNDAPLAYHPGEMSDQLHDMAFEDRLGGTGCEDY